MKRTLKQSLLVAATAGLAVSFVTGCTPDSTSSKQSETSSQNTSSVVDQQQAVNEYNRKEPKVMDLNNRTIKIVQWWDDTPKRHESLSMERYFDRIEEIQEKFKCKIEFVEIPMQSYAETVIASIVSGQPVGDLAYFKNNTFLSGVANNCFVALDDLNVFDFNDPIWSSLTLDATTFRGKHYGIISNDHNSSFIAYNNRIIEETGLESPYSLFQKGEWTWEKMREIAIKATKKNGNKQQYGYAGYLPDFDLEAFVHSNGGTWWQEDGDTYKLGLNSENSMEAINFLNSLNTKDKVIFHGKDAYAWESRVQEFVNGNVAFYHGAGYWLVRYFKDMADDFTLVPFPKGTKSSEHVYAQSDVPFYAILGGTKKPEEVAAVYNYLAGQPYKGEEKYDWMNGWEIYLRNEESIETMKYLDEKVTKEFDPRGQFGFDYVKVIEFTDKLQKEAPSTIMEQYKQVFDAAVSDAMSKFKK